MKLITLKVPPKWITAVKSRAATEQRSMASLIRLAALEYIKRAERRDRAA